MKKAEVFLCFIFLFVIISDLNALSQTPVTSKKVTIHAEKGWQSSGVILKKEQVYLFFA